MDRFNYHTDISGSRVCIENLYKQGIKKDDIFALGYLSSCCWLNSEEKQYFNELLKIKLAEDLKNIVIDNKYGKSRM